MSYTQLTQDERYQIYELLHEGKTPAQIGRQLGRDRRTIERELARNTGQRGYRPHQAQQKAQERRVIPRRPRKLTGALRDHVEERLKADWSPEQIAGALKAQGAMTLSHERIYQHVLEDKAGGGELHQHLRRASRKRRKRYGQHDRRGMIPNRRSIEERPREVERRERLGDWEVDSVLGRQESQAIISLVERRSRYTLLFKVAARKAEAVAAGLVRALAPHPVRTLTSDNGREFARHEQVAEQLACEFFFAHPYRSCERGTNENTNGLVRQYVPKKCSLDRVDEERLRFVMERLNHRPRKCLGYRTPHEVFFARPT